MSRAAKQMDSNSQGEWRAKMDLSFFFTENKIYCSKEGEVVMGLLSNILYLQNSHNSMKMPNYMEKWVWNSGSLRGAHLQIWLGQCDG